MLLLEVIDYRKSGTEKEMNLQPVLLQL